MHEHPDSDTLTTAPAQAIPPIAPGQGPSTFAIATTAGSAERAPPVTAPPLKRPNRNQPANPVGPESEAAIWKEIDQTAPTRAELELLHAGFHSEPKTD